MQGIQKYTQPHFTLTFRLLEGGFSHWYRNLGVLGSLIILIDTCLPIPFQTGNSVITWLQRVWTYHGNPCFLHSLSATWVLLLRCPLLSTGPGFWSFFPGHEWGFQWQASNPYGLCTLPMRATGLVPASTEPWANRQDAKVQDKVQDPQRLPGEGQGCDHYVCGHRPVSWDSDQRLLKIHFFFGNLGPSRKV